MPIPAQTLDYITAAEKMVGEGHDTLADTLNRALRQVLTVSGYDPDATFYGFAKKLEGIPVMATTVARDAAFPTPDTDQRVYNKQTVAFERYTGSAWVIDISGAAPVISASIVPTADASYDLGSGSYRFRDAYLSRDAAIGRNVTIGGTLGVTGDTTVGNITIGGTSSHAGAASFAAAVTFNSTIQANGNVTVGAAATLAATTANLTTANITTANITTLNWAGVFTIAGNLYANADAAYDIGQSADKRFRDFYLSRDAVIGRNITISGSVLSDLLFTDATYDIGKSGATRPRDVFTSRDVTVGRNIILGGTLRINGVTYTWPSSQSANRVLTTDGAGTLTWALPSEVLALDTLSDVTITSAAAGEMLRYSGSAWVNSTDGSALTALNASNLASGTVANARLSGGYTGVTALGTQAADLLFTDATYDIGKTGATRPRDIFASRNVTIGGTIGVTGTATFGVMGAGATTVTTLHASSTSALDGDVTLGNRLLLSTAVGKIVPGATSLSLRNNADAADNILIADNGNITLRGTLGGITTLTATTLGGTLATAAQPNVTSLGTLAANLLFTDASYDIGQSGATRPRHGYFSGSITLGGTLTGTLVNTLTFGTHLAAGGSSFNNSANVTISTDATSANTASAIVARDSSGNFSAGTVTATLSGAAPAGSLSGATLASGVTASSLTSFGSLAAHLLFVDNTYDIGASGATRPRSIYVAANITVGGSYTGNLAKTLTFGTHLTGSSFNNAADVTIATDAVSTATASTIVARDGSGNFAATTITAALTGNASTATALATARNINGVAFDGTGNITVTAAAGTLSGATLASGVTASSLTSFGTLAADLLFTDASYDLGKSGATRPRDGFFSRNVTIGGTGTVVGNLTAQGALILGTDGSGADAAASDVLVEAPRSTGNATPAGFQFMGTRATGSGSSLQSWFNTLRLAADVAALGQNGSGSNAAATAYVITAPVSTGSATPATLTIKTTHVGSSGSTAQTLENLVILGDRAVTLLSTATLTLGASSWTTTAAVLGGTLSTAGNITAATDATYDIGASGANRFRDAFLSRNLTVGGTLTTSDTVTHTKNGAALVLNSGAGSTNVWLDFADNGTNKWEFIKNTTNQFQIYSYALGAAVVVFHATTGVPTFGTGITVTGNLLAGTDASYDIGASGATRFRDLFLSRDAVVGGNVCVGGGVKLTGGNTNEIILGNNTSIRSVNSAGDANHQLIGQDVTTNKVRIAGSAQTVIMPSYGAGAATFDASGNISSVSDERLKIIDGPFTAGLAAVRKIQPIIHRWRKKSGMETRHQYAGFSAQNVQRACALATGRDGRGFLTLQDRAVIAMLVNAVRTLDNRLRKLERAA